MARFPEHPRRIDLSQLDRSMSRRGLLQLGGAAGVLGVLAACSSSSGSSTGSTAQNLTPASGGSSDISQLAQIFAPIDPTNSGKGKTFPLGAVIPLTGSSASYGVTYSQSINLAVKQIAALGGPTIEVTYKDSGQGDATLGIAATRELGSAKVPAMVSSFGGNFGSMFPAMAQYEILSLDPGGGTGGPPGEGKPYFWGTISVEPEDQYGGIMKYIQAKMPNVKRFAQVGYDLGTARTNEIKQVLTQALSTIGAELVYFGTFAIGATDYTDVLSKLQASNADASFLFSGGNDIVNYLKQYNQVGLDKPVFTDTYTSQILSDSGPAIKLVYFSLDEFDGQHPVNPWAKYFVTSFKEAYGLLPVQSAANNYETVFIFWTLIQRVLKNGGDIMSGTDLQNALIADPTFLSVHGGTPTQVGKLTFNTTTHSPSYRPIGLYTYDPTSASFTLVAQYSIGGQDFSLV
jgi:branched-chain amino acid transport system substrate-binding protein